MSEQKLTLGKAIDQIIEALDGFDGKDRKAILNTVCSHLQIELGAAATTPPDAPKPSPPIQQPTAQQRPQNENRQAGSIDIRSLREAKKPASARQMACLVAYYLQEFAPADERKDVVTTKELETYFKQAAFKLPTALEQLLKDCKQAGYFQSPGRGQFKLTRVGYNLVAHGMPRAEG